MVPATAETMAASRCANLLRILDFPTFGAPKIAIARPSRSRSPRCWSARCRAISDCRSSISLSICDRHRIAGEVQPHLDHVPRGARDGRDNGRLALRQPIENTGFSDVRGAQDSDRQAIAQPFAAMLVRQVPGDLGLQILDLAIDR